MADLYGLIGKNIAYSRSPELFEQFFNELNINAQYRIFDVKNESLLENILQTDHLKGVNITIPYKEKIIRHLDVISPEAQKTGAVNTVKISGNKRYGYNTDIYGFEESLKEKLQPFHRKAFILGNGATAKTVQYVLNRLGISYQIISRFKQPGILTYADITPELLQTHLLIINTTPLGNMNYPGEKAPLPYHALTDKHFLYDLNYKPSLTPFLQEGLKRKAQILNGEKMLMLQARKSLEIWLNA